MSRKPNSIEGQFAAFPIEMLKSPGLRGLSMSAYRVLFRIEIELARHGGQDNGRLAVTFDQFEEYGVRRHSIGPALHELTLLGFLEITEEGVAGKGIWRKPNRFRLTYRSAFGKPPTNEWKTLRPVVERHSKTIFAQCTKRH
jgi:hypothetical protein